MSKQFLRPGDGRRVVLPGGYEVPRDGAAIDVDLFIRRRIDCGDLVAEARPPSAIVASASVAATEENV